MNKVRGFEPVQNQYLKQDGNYIMPLRCTKNSGGYDFFSPINKTIPSGKTECIWINIKSYMLDDEILQIHVRGSIGIKKGLQLANLTGIVDSDFHNNPDNDGNIGIFLYNRNHYDVEIKAGDRIAQGIFVKYLIADNCNSENERTGGFGSTGTGVLNG